jgi:NNP family nitrate/nitrite transporter-like MFS transporter
MAMGIAGAGNSGTLLSTLFAPRLAEAHGWHMVFGLAIIPLAVAALVFFLFAKEAPQAASQSSSSEFLSVLKERDTYLFGFFYAVTFGGFVGLASFLSIFLRDQYGISKIHAGDLTSLCVLSGSFLRPVGGFLADRLGGIRMLIYLYSSLVLLVLAAAQLPALGMIVPLLFLIMACLGLGNGSVFQLVPQRFGHRVGVATGILGAAGGLGGFFLPTVVGWVKQASGSYGFGLSVLAGCAAMALALLLLAQREWIGAWIAKGGRVHPVRPVLAPEEAEPV